MSVVESLNCRQARGSLLDRLQAVVLLAGSVRPTPLGEAIQRSVMDLPVEGGSSLMDDWRAQGAALANSLHLNKISIRVVVDRQSPLPFVRGDEAGARVGVAVERDPMEFRGTGGVLRDLCAAYADDDVVLVATGAQVLEAPLAKLATMLAETGGDASVVSHRSGTPSNLMLLKAGVLRDLAAVGFVDMKEQALPTIARRHRVRVVELDSDSGLSVRTAADYVAALRRRHRRLSGQSEESAAFAEDWAAAFGLVEPGASVGDNVRLHDSVVLSGAKVGRDAVLVRTIVCPGAVVPSGAMLIDTVAR